MNSFLGERERERGRAREGEKATGQRLEFLLRKKTNILRSKAGRRQIAPSLEKC